MKEDIYSINQSSLHKELIDLQICGVSYCDKTYTITRNKSPICCIEYVESGTGTVIADNMHYHPSCGDSYFLQSGQDQHYYSDAENPWKKYFINLRGRIVNELIEGYQLKNINYFKALDIKNELCEIIEKATDTEKDYTFRIIEILNKIFYKMYLHKKTENKPVSLPMQMREFLDMRITKKFQISELCDFASKSESQVIRLFKSAYKTTPYAYFMDKKVELAKSMLKNTNLTIKQISYNLSFADEYYFSNVFKQKTGVSPTKYRRGCCL